MGFGPLLKFSRAGVAVQFDGKIGCIVCHQHLRNQCKHAKIKTCYLCPHNPFYEVIFDREGVVKRVPPHIAVEAALPVGQTLLLDMNSVELNQLLQDIGGNVVRGARSRSKKRRRFTYDLVSMDPIDEEEGGNATSSQQQPVTARDPDNWLLVRLDVPRIFTPRDGMIYVSVEISYTRSRDVVDSRGFYVHPSDLAMPENGGDEELVRRKIIL